MSKEVIKKIREVEAQADKIKSDARDEARARVQKAQIEGKKMYDDQRAKSHQLNVQRLDCTRDKADEFLQKVRTDAAADANKMREEAEFNMREAIRFIISGVEKQCQ